MNEYMYMYMYMYTCTCVLKYIHVHDVIGDVERKRKKERKTPEAMEK